MSTVSAVKRTRAKYCRSKRAFPTKMVKGNGNNRGSTVPGHVAALRDIEAVLGRPLRSPRRLNNRFQWVFKEG
jgi:hypothetical protein